MLHANQTRRSVQCAFVRRVTKAMVVNVLILMNVATVMISVTQRLTVQTLWDPTTVHVTWVLKETDSTANPTAHAQELFVRLMPNV